MKVAIAVVVIAIVCIGLLTMILLRQRSAEQTATHTHDPTRDGASERLYGGVDRPAGPDVEDQSMGDPTVGGTSQPGADPDAPLGRPGL